MRRRATLFLTALSFVFVGSACADSHDGARAYDHGNDHITQEVHINADTEDAVKIAHISKTQSPNSSTLQITPQTPIETRPAPVSQAGFQAKVPLDCVGVIKQGGAVRCQTLPDQKVKIARTPDDFYYETADKDGILLVGFDRDEKRTIISADQSVIDYNFTPRDYKISRIDGLPPSQVSSFSEAQLKKIRSSTARKTKGFASRAQNVGLVDGFTYPVEDARKTSPFGAQRILNGEPKRPHFGVDMAAPVGTPIYAPADGTISLADDDLYFEGAMVMIDHGQGLNSMYLHVSEIYVEAGQWVKRGDKIAAIGSKGRSTGPHLCWRLKWRNRNLDPEILTEWPIDAPIDGTEGDTHNEHH